VIHNERVKLVMQALSNTGVAITATGVITPVVAVLYGTAPLNATLFPVTPALLFIGIAFHVLAQLALGRLKDV
jgi:VIT1/CCC1 family predicted Fe2+/Mn2+ transporter